MALKSRTYACEACDGQFTILKDDRDPPPAHCACCGASTGDDPEPILNFSRIGKAANQSLDKTYRAMESASIGRAEQAASDLGVSVSEVSDIKMTNMRDNLREGDTSFIAPTPSRQTGQMTGGVSVATADQVAGLRGGPNKGPSPGTVTLDQLRPSHAARARQMARAGEQGRFNG